LHSLALRLAGFFLKREELLLAWIIGFNLFYLVIHAIVLLAYAVGEFSILSGWEVVQTAAESGVKSSSGKILIAAFLAIVIPLALFFMSIIYGYASYQRILNPRELLYDEEYGLKSFNTKKTEDANALAEIQIQTRSQASRTSDLEDPARKASNRGGSMGFARFMARTFAVGGTARYVAKGFFVALGHGILNTDNMETEEGLKEELHEFAQYILISRLNGPTAEFHKMLQLYEEFTGPGLTGLTIAILAVEAGFMENSEENQDMFREVIVEELVKKGIGERML
jgi:hypothetical protein